MLDFCGGPARRWAGPAARIICLAILILAAPLHARAQEKPDLPWRDHQTALDLARRNDKPVLIFFSAPWCYLCKQMKRKVFSDNQVIRLMGSDLLIANVDVTKQKPIAEKYGVNYLPTTLFLGPQGKVLESVRGYIPKANFIRLLIYYGQGHYKLMSFAEFCARNP